MMNGQAQGVSLTSAQILPGSQYAIHYLLAIGCMVGDGVTESRRESIEVPKTVLHEYLPNTRRSAIRTLVAA